MDDRTTANELLSLAKFGVEPAGHAAKRTRSLVQGQGRYTDDINHPKPGLCGDGALDATRMESFSGIDTDAARAMPGVLGGADRRGPQGLRRAEMHPADSRAVTVRRSSMPPRPRWRATRCVSSAIRSPAWWPKPWRKRKTRPRRWRSISSRCPRSSLARDAAKPGAPQLYDEVPGNIAHRLSARRQRARSPRRCKNAAHVIEACR